MTVITGMLSKDRDGVVIGADSSQTTAQLSSQTTDKIEEFDEVPLLYAGAGSVASIQSFSNAIRNYINEVQGGFSPGRVNLPNNNHYDIRQPEDPVQLIISFYTEIFQGQLKRAQNITGETPAFSALITFPFSENLELFHVNSELTVVRIEQKPWYRAIGIGTEYIEPFFRFLNQHLWDDKLLGYEDSQFFSYWSIKHAIDVESQGISGPIDIRGIQNNGGQFSIDPRDEQLREKIQEWEKTLKETWEEYELPTGTAEDIPDPE